MSQKPSKIFTYLPILLAIVLVAGIYLGKMLNNSNPKNIRFLTDNNSQASSDKINFLLTLIQKNYVDTVNIENISEKAIIDLLEQLDPHSVYIPAKELNEVNETMQGNFEGIGIEFNVIRDTLCVLSVISGGPSEKAGLMPGDKIISVNDSTIAGKKMSNKEIMGKLRGPKGTTVSVGIMRQNKQNLLAFKIERGKIPLYSIDVTYVINKETGYIKISRFSETTHDEFVKAIDYLKKEKVKQLILDLRGNGGGLMDEAIKICDEFLDNNKLIVYTAGKSTPKKEHFASRKGALSNFPLVVLIDENSASASEIVAGAIQDNDRGIIVGRRSFGKGLVQNQIDLPDGSAVRLTIARYYTPSGRCIQKPYGKGLKDYYKEEEDRYENGELFSKDSIKVNDSLKYKTSKGRIVYGGGGIVPDVFVAVDTSGKSAFLNKLIYNSIFNQFCFDFVNCNKSSFDNYTIESYKSNFTVSDKMVNELIAYSTKAKVEYSAKQFEKSKVLIKQYLKASIARILWNNEGFYPVYNENDPAVLKAVDLLLSAKN